MKNVKTSIRWIPGHEGIKGNEIVNAAARELHRSNLCCSGLTTSHPSLGKNTGEQENPKPGIYDPIRAIDVAKNAIKKRLAHKKKEAEYGMPSGFKRYETVRLRRLQAGSAITPSVLKRWEDKKKARQNTDFVPEQYQCKYCKEHTPADIQHLMWECKHHEEARHATLDQLKPQDRPPTLKDWLNPVGETARRNIILGSVLTYLEKTGLGDDI
ncbi:hypothetical protein HPB47_007721 [Ixodes persulcatus]|uniref:Uncharacterized protein n=1 Tax=Ixodes persulcatus TaxID=34615 RepID=A0AC60P6M3_IXOPE|nr:hypothetical protein HPB47_007721 [Ixodes persulcatus]